MPGLPRRKYKSREDICRFGIVFRVLMTKPAKTPVFLSEHIFASSLRLRILFSQFETLEKNACEYLWKEYDRELSPWTSIGTSRPSDTQKRFPRFARPVQDDPLTPSVQTGDPSEMLDNLLRPRNEFVAHKPISVFREADRVSKEARLVRE